MTFTFDLIDVNEYEALGTTNLRRQERSRSLRFQTRTRSFNHSLWKYFIFYLSLFLSPSSEQSSGRDKADLLMSGKYADWVKNKVNTRTNDLERSNPKKINEE